LWLTPLLQTSSPFFTGASSGATNRQSPFANRYLWDMGQGTRVKERRKWGNGDTERQGKLFTANGEWQMANGEWFFWRAVLLPKQQRIAISEWRIDNGELQTALFTHPSWVATKSKQSEAC
jgi:hypothetical protein